MNAKLNEMLDTVVTRLDEDALIEQTLLEANQELHALMESVGYELEADSLEEAFFAVADFMESEEFAALSEEEQSKVKQGFKMVFGKLRKLGAAAKQMGKEVFSKKGMRQIGALVRSGEAGRLARGVAGKAVGKLDRASGGAISKAGGAAVKAADKLTGGKATRAISRSLERGYAKSKESAKKYAALTGK